MYALELWQLNACIRAYNRRREAEVKAEIANAWRTANWAGAAFAGKLKRLDHYLPDVKKPARPVTREQMAEIDKRFEERRGGDVAGKP